MKLLITGGAGFIGSHTVSAIERISPDVEITVFDNFSTGSVKNLDDTKATVIEGDLNDSRSLRKAVDGSDTVIHLAAIGSVPRSIENPAATFESNVVGTFNLLESCRLSGVSNIIFSSSSSVYGANQKLPKTELDWTSPVSPYGASKLACEGLIAGYSHAYDIRTICFRFFNVFGPRQLWNHPYAAVIPKLIYANLSGGPFSLHGDGLQSRDFTYVSDVAEILAMSVEKRIDGHNLINLAFGKPVTVRQVIEIVEETTGRKTEITHSPARAGDIQKSLSDPTVLAGFAPHLVPRELKDGIKDTVEYIKNRLGIK